MAGESLVDWHMHVWEPDHLGGQWLPELERRYPGISKAAVFDRTDEARESGNVDYAAIIGLNCHHTDMVIPNEYVAEYVERHPTSTVGFGSVDPTDPRAPDELRYCAEELGLVGLKLAPPYQGFHPHAPQAWTIYRLAADLGLVVMFHQGASFVPRGILEYASPVLLDAIARELPDLRIVVAHAGHPWFVDTIALLYKHRNVYADLSARCQRTWQLYQIIRMSLDYDVTDKLLFGTDFPITTPQRSLDGLLGLGDSLPELPKIDESVLKGIAFDRPLSLLGIQARS